MKNWIKDVYFMHTSKVYKLSLCQIDKTTGILYSRLENHNNLVNLQKFLNKGIQPDKDIGFKNFSEYLIK